MPAPWFYVALEELERGVHELPGEATHPRVRLYLDSLDSKLGVGSDEVAWCAAFVNWCIQQTGRRGTGKPNARSYLKWGDPCEPHLGAVAVLWRVRPTSWQGHVGLLVDRHDKEVLLLGGNQGNRVSVASFPSEQVLGFRTLEGA